MKPINLAIILALGTFGLNSFAAGTSDSTQTDVQSGSTYQSAPGYEAGPAEGTDLQAEEDLSMEPSGSSDIQAEEVDPSFGAEDSTLEEEIQAEEEALEDDNETYNEQQTEGEDYQE